MVGFLHETRADITLLKFLSRVSTCTEPLASAVVVARGEGCVWRRRKKKGDGKGEKFGSGGFLHPCTGVRHASEWYAFSVRCAGCTLRKNNSHKDKKPLSYVSMRCHQSFLPHVTTQKGKRRTSR